MIREKTIRKQKNSLQVWDADDSGIFLTTSARETYNPQFFVCLYRAVVAAKWSGNTFLEINNGNDLALKITLKAKKSETTLKQRKGGVRNHFGKTYTLFCAAYKTQKCQGRLCQVSVSHIPIAVMYSALNITEIGDPATKFTAVKISFEVIYLFAIVSECALT